MADPRVSVVTIFLDAAPFLAAAIDSVRAQTWTDWELLLVDDGSTDGSTAIAHAAAARDPRIRVLCHDGRRNRGMSASRNLGLARARGGCIAFLDADDVWLPTRLERHLALLDSSPDCAMVCGPTRMWFGWIEDEAGRAGERDPLRSLGVATGVVLHPPDYLVAILDEHARTPAMCSITLRTEAVRATGGFDDDFRDLFEDQVFLAKLLIRERVLATGECLDLYRQHPASACYVARLRGIYHGAPGNLHQRAFIERLDRLLRESPARAPALERAVDRWRQRYLHPIRTRLADAWRDPRRSIRIWLRAIAAALLPGRMYRRVWARAQGFDFAHGEPPAGRVRG